MHFVEAKGILSARNGMNIYRGCTHGCIYCDARSSCYRMAHAFEDVEVKRNAPELLRAALRRKRKKCMVSTGAMGDPYAHCESELGLTRRCLEIIREEGFGVALQTKSALVLRDMDLLGSINSQAKAVVQMTLTTVDEGLCRVLEPNVSSTRERYAALKAFQSRGIPTVVWFSPVLPFINDTEENLRGILGCCFDAGVRGIVCFGMGTTIRDGDREHFYAALDRHFPGLKEMYVRRYGLSYECLSDNSPRLMRIFHDECERHGVMHSMDGVFAYLRDFPAGASAQLELF